MKRLAVVIMAKHPSPGSVKTRLLPQYTPEQAAAIHRLFLVHTVGRVLAQDPGSMVLSYHPPETLAAMRALFPGSADQMEWIPQDQGDLGARISAAAERVLAAHERVLFLGADAPDVPRAHLAMAVEQTCGNDVALGRTEDGGYWCLGLSRNVSPARLLAGIPWSSGREADQTLLRARELGYSAGEAPGWYDVDYAADLQALVRRLGASGSDPDAELLRELGRVLPQGFSV